MGLRMRLGAALTVMLLATLLLAGTASPSVAGLLWTTSEPSPGGDVLAVGASTPEDGPPVAPAPGPPSRVTPVFPVAAPSPRTAPAPDGLSNIYIGGMHSAHTVRSDGRLQYPDEFYSSFRRYWDWVATTDHDHGIDPANWQEIVQGADGQNDDAFVSLVGYEWSSPNWGHLSVMFKGDPPLPALGLARSADPASDTPRELFDILRRGNGLAGFAHPSLAGCPIDFGKDGDYRDDAVAPLAGIFGFRDTVHWSAMWDYGDGNWVPAAMDGDVEGRGWIRNALDRGYRLGFVGELDMHEKAVDPLSYRYTGVIAGGLTRADIFEALKMRHTYAVRSPGGLGKRILIKADADGHLMGDVFDCESNVLKVTLDGKTDLQRFAQVNVFVNGERVERRAVSGQSLSESFSLILPAGENYAFFEVRAMAANGQVSQAVTSPMYVTVGRPAGSAEVNLTD